MTRPDDKGSCWPGCHGAESCWGHRSVAGKQPSPAYRGLVWCGETWPLTILTGWPSSAGNQRSNRRKGHKGHRSQDCFQGGHPARNQTGHRRCQLSSSMHPGLVTGGSLCSSSLPCSSSASQLHTTTLSSFSASSAAVAREGGHREPPEALAPHCGTLRGLKLRAPLTQPGWFPPRSPSKDASLVSRPLLSALLPLTHKKTPARAQWEVLVILLQPSSRDNMAESRLKLSFSAVTERKQQRPGVKWNRSP